MNTRAPRAISTPRYREPRGSHHPLDDSRRSVSRRVIDDDDLSPAGRRLGRDDAVEALLDMRLVVEERHDDADTRGAGCREGGVACRQPRRFATGEERATAGNPLAHCRPQRLVDVARRRRLERREQPAATVGHRHLRPHAGVARLGKPGELAGLVEQFVADRRQLVDGAHQEVVAVTKRRGVLAVLRDVGGAAGHRQQRAVLLEVGALARVHREHDARRRHEPEAFGRRHVARCGRAAGP
jgi:hypothetical protein